MKRSIGVRILALSLLLAPALFAADNNAFLDVYDLRGALVGKILSTRAVDKPEVRRFRSGEVVTVGERPIEFSAGLYIVAPPSFGGAGGGLAVRPSFGFQDMTAAYLPAALWPAGDVEAADLNGDGRIDIVCSRSDIYCDSILNACPRVWIQTAQGTFVDETSSRMPFFPSSTLDIELFDADGDGDIDIFVCGYSCVNHQLAAALLMNDGTGFFSNQSAQRLPQLPIGSFSYFAEAADVDGNGSKDLVLNVWNEIDTLTHQWILPELWLNNGSGYFSRDTQGRLPSSTRYGHFELSIADIDANGMNDIIFGNMAVIITGPGGPEPIDTLSGQLACFRNLGNGYFVDETSLRMPGPITRSTRDLAVGDVDNDGDYDILDVGFFWGNSDPQVRLLLNNGTGYYSVAAAALPQNLVGWFNDSRFARLNADNLPDLFMTKVLPGEPSYDVLLVNNGSGGFIDSSSLLPPNLDFSVSCVMFDHQNDGDLDVFVANAHESGEGGQNRLYQNTLLASIPGGDPSTSTREPFLLSQNFPNPFNPSTTIRFSLPRRAQVALRLFDVLGREVTTLLDREMEAGEHNVSIEAEGLPTGAYVCRLEVPGFVQTRKLVLLR
jgi:hypothetical protein